MKKTVVAPKLSTTLLTLGLTLAAPLAGYAQAQQCGPVFQFETAEVKFVETVLSPKAARAKELRNELEANYQTRNKILSTRYPQLEFIFKDPEAFVTSMKQRFEAQKKITPDDPRLFNFPEASTTMKEIRGDLEKFRQDVIADLQLNKSSIVNRLSHTVTGKRSEKVETLTKTLQYIKKVQADIDKMITADNYPYRDTVYTLYYYSRIRGIFQFKELTPYYQVTKYIDMVMHGYRRLNINQELTLYRNQGSPLLQVRSGKIASEFRTAELPFRDAFERRDTLEYVIIPSVYALGSSAFMHVLPHKIHFIGATNTPIQADGFNRPGGLFWMHDVRHEADRYMKINAYRKVQNLTPAQENLLSLHMQKWHAEFLAFKNAVTDKNLRASLDHYHFYTHHDVGVPLIPSMFLNHHDSGMSVYYAFLFHKKNAGQEYGFHDWFKTTKETQKLLEGFWKERLPQEKELLQKDPVKMTNWAEWFPQSHADAQSATAILNRAVESKSFVRLTTDVAGIEGTLSKVVYNENGQPIYVNFAGKAQLVNKENKVIPGQGPNVHGEGYSTPIGAIKSITANGSKIEISQIKENQVLEIQYESGIVVRGELKTWTLDEIGKLSILTFKTAEINLNDKVLYKPEWGSFDLLMGTKIESFDQIM